VFIQLDNTVKQCKSQYMMGFAGMLLLSSAIRTIVISFLPVGHTHEDIDQLFSRISEYFKNRNVYTKEAMLRAIKKACTKYGKPPVVEDLDNVANFSEYIKPHMANWAGLTEFYQFVFKLDAAGVVKCQMREDMSSNFKFRGLKKHTTWTNVFKDGAEEKIRRRPFAGIKTAQLRAVGQDPAVEKESTQWLEA
jgi:hypothetical protein